MKKKILSFVLATMLVSTTGMPIMAQAEELPVVAEETVTEAPVAETPVIEELIVETSEAETTETDKAAVETDNEPIVVENEVETASDENMVVADVEVEEEVSEEDDAIVLTEDEESELKSKLEEELEEKLEVEEEIKDQHEHDIIYVPMGNHQHKAMCAVGGDDCDFEEEIVDCVDEDKDNYCDLCHESMKDKEFQKTSGITITVHSWTPFLDENGEEIVDMNNETIAVYQDITISHVEVEGRIIIADMITQFNENDIYLDIDVTPFKSLDGIDAVYEEILAIGEELPSDTHVVITEKEGSIEGFSVEYEDNYDPELEEDSAANKKTDSDKETLDENEDTIMAKEDEILPDRVVSDVVEDEANGEVVEDEQLIDDETAAEIMESVPDAAEAEVTTESSVEEAPTTEAVETTETVVE